MIFILSCLCGALVYELAFVLMNFQKGKRKSALISGFPEALVFGVAIGTGLWVREQLAEGDHPLLASLAVMVVIAVVGQLLVSYISKKSSSR